MKRTIKISAIALLSAFSTASLHAQEDALFINDKGKVGIGTPNPECNLTISNASGISAFGVDNGAVFSAKNKNGLYENYFWPRATDNKMYLNYGITGFEIRTNNSNKVITMTSSGNVGIGGSLSPANKLQVDGDIHTIGNAVYLRGGDGTDKNDFIRWNDAGDLVQVAGYRGVSLGYTAGSPYGDPRFVKVLSVDDNRNVNVNGSIYTRIDRNSQGRLWGTSKIGMFSHEFVGMELESRAHNNRDNADGCGGIIKFYTFGYYTRVSEEVIRITERGRMGIGTTDPQAPLEVVGHNLYNTSRVFGFLNNGGGHGPHDGQQNDRKVSILANEDICTKNNFIAYSDRRIKKDLLRSDNAKDLAVLKQLQVTDYKYVDNVNHADDYKKGFIAQEVEKVFPEAVSIGRDFVPDIFAAPLAVTEKGGSITFTMAREHHLKDNDIVRVYTSKGMKDKPVAVQGNKVFSIADAEEGAYKESFVYGKVVTDFRSVDYDRLFTLNVSATQQLAREVEALKAENELLKKQNAATKDQLTKSNEVMASVVSRLETLEAASGKLHTTPAKVSGNNALSKLK